MSDRDYKSHNYSYMDYLKDNKIINDNDDIAYPIKQKTIFIKPSSLTGNFKDHWSKTGINIFKNNPNLNEWDVEDTISIDNGYNTVSKKIEYLTNDMKCIYNDREIFEDVYSQDSHSFLQMKKEMLYQYLIPFDHLRNTKCYHYLKTSHFISKQLLHFSLLDLKPGSFSIFNCGIPNMICIIAGCYNKVNSENGKPFMFVILTRNPDYYDNFFGNIKKIEYDNGYTLIISNWRRLPTSKLTFLRDSYYSVLSSTMNSMMSLSNQESYLEPLKYKTIFSTRTIISLCTNQKLGELLMDNRYAYMSSFSLYTNIDRLLKEKFGPPYRSDIEAWVVKRIFTRLPKIHDYFKTGIAMIKPEFYDGQRTRQSLGGNIFIPSLWGNYNITDVQEVMDEAFIYVHTMKEPSSVYYEQVKAIKTIMDFQIKYNNLDYDSKMGNYKNYKDIRNYLLSDTQIGFSSAIINESVKMTIKEEKPYIKKFIHEINDESISEIISTKAVISDIEREMVIEEKIQSKKYIKKHYEKLIKYGYGSKEEIPENIKKDISNLKSYYLKTKSNYYNERKPRQKVFETILDVVEENKHLNRTVLLANNFIEKDKGKVIADICIKSQYGSKREFYVINVGAKAIARCTENFFKKLSENSKHEAISIAGDKKTLEMQRMLDRAYMNIPVGEDYNICFVNGDCTKWSAAETMGSFLSMVNAMKEFITSNMYELLCATFNSWSKKEIQVPTDIYNKYVVPQSDVEKKINMGDDNIIENGVIKSTQKFFTRNVQLCIIIQSCLLYKLYYLYMEKNVSR